MKNSSFRGKLFGASSGELLLEQLWGLALGVWRYSGVALGTSFANNFLGITVGRSYVRRSFYYLFISKLYILFYDGLYFYVIIYD